MKILASKGAKAYILDLNPPDEALPPNVEYIECNITSWSELRGVFERVKKVDIAVANAGVSEEANYFEDTFDEAGQLLEPRYAVLEVNYRAVLNFVKLSISHMRAAGGGSIVITASATAYAPEQSLPVYSSTKLAVSPPYLCAECGYALTDFLRKVIGLMRSLRASLHLQNISINCVAPAATITKLLPKQLATPLMAAGLPVSSADFVGLAVAYSATAKQTRSVEPYGKDPDEEVLGPWNGRTILTLGDNYTELEEPIASLRPQWLGEKNAYLTRAQQSATDFRELLLNKDQTEVLN